jgi:putative toxin-antitoxin system antitoxin component (TIGR02293 family)
MFLASDPFSLLDRPLGEVASRLRAGLPVAAFDALQEALGVPAAELAAPMHIAPRTLARRKKEGTLTAEESDQLFRIARLFKLAERLLGTRDSARRWFTTPKSALGGESPLTAADTHPGSREIEDLLGRIEFGVFG